MCPEGVVRCPYYQIDCKKMVKTTELPSHIKSETEGHLELAMNAVVGLTAIVSELATKCNVTLQSNNSIYLACQWLVNSKTLAYPPWIVQMDNFVKSVQKMLNATLGWLPNVLGGVCKWSQKC